MGSQTVVGGRATITDNAMTILNKRYLHNGESVNSMWHRVADGNQEYISLLEQLLFLPNSPTLFNAGLNNGCTLSACFVFNVADNMRDTSDSIVGTRDKAIAVAKAGGGVGYYFGNLRPKGSPIKSIQRVACGPVAVMKDYHGISSLITQGGKRDLAQMGVLPVWHDDVRDFIHCKDEDPQSLSSFNISVSWPNHWADKALSDPNSNGSAGKERSIWDQQVDSAWKHGCPGMFFVDHVNKNNPNKHIGDALAPNPCGETPNRGDEPCSLGSVNLWRFVCLKTRKFLWGMFEDAVRVSFNLLDDILDRNLFPHPDITKASLLTRKLGLGVMGWADTLALLGIHYDTEEAVDFGEKTMQFIEEVTLDQSIKLAKIKGPYPGYDPDKTQGPCARNETRTSIAPTGTISIIANASSSIEPHYLLEWERTTKEGIVMREKIPVAHHLDGFVPKTASEIDWPWHVRHQAAFQRHTDLGVSKTINMPNSATRQDVSDAYAMMYKMECKGGTVFRDGCRSEQVLKAVKKTSVFSTAIDNKILCELGKKLVLMTPEQLENISRLLDGNVCDVSNKKRKLSGKVNSIRQKFRIDGTKGYLHVGLYPDNTPGEIFLRVSNHGSSVSGMLDTWAKTFSNGLQMGTPLEELVRLHKGTRFEPNGVTGVESVPVCTSIPDFVVRWMEIEFLKKKVEGTGELIVSAGMDSGMFCPECDKEAILQGGCLVCVDKSCGWTRCS